MAFEGLRRASTEFDRRLLQAHIRRCERERELMTRMGLLGDGGGRNMAGGAGGDGNDGGDSRPSAVTRSTGTGLELESMAPTQSDGVADLVSERLFDGYAFPPFRPSFATQLGRTLLHTLQLVMAYLMMLMAMYYNGYIILCIFAGTFIGHFMFHWERVGGVAKTSLATNDPKETADRRREDKQRGWAEKLQRGL
ncbi:hypothetical protein ACRALDRAFT_1069438 [Sodiomyces alcalophilus JCM 7366]|uniref:uncharacterized protein n=1 Tax=Sodiomyces alcalophilus JCM 7366 TaxID=591952 RepID=UPI0039B4255F